MLTFDDGFKDFADRAMPILASCGFTATVFVVVDWVGRTNDWPGQPSWVPRRRLLDWDTLRAIAQAGIEIGAHSFSHRPLAQLRWQDTEREITECGRAIEDRIGGPVRAFAYPYGQTSETMEEVVATHFQAGFSTRLGFATGLSCPASLERIDAYYVRPPKFFRALHTEWFGRYLRVRRWLRDLRRAERKVA